MSITNTLMKLLTAAEKVMKEEGFTDKDVKETFEYAQKVTKKSIISEDKKSMLLNAFEKAKKDSKK